MVTGQCSTKPCNQVVFSVFLSFQIASELWPVTAAAEASDEESHGDLDGAAVDVEEDLEKQIAKELATIKRPRKEQRFGMSSTHVRVQTSESTI